jgi:DNA modification methylase
MQSNWKPVLVYGEGPRANDVITSGDGDLTAKAYHEWGQDLAGFAEIVRRFTRPGMTVCDPLAGSGTTLLAARAQGRHAIGAEIDPVHFETMRRRLS